MARILGGAGFQVFSPSGVRPSTPCTSKSAKVFLATVPSPPAEESEFSVFSTATPRSVEAPSLWARDRVSKIACTVDDRRVVKEAGSFRDSTLARFFPLVEEDETLLKVLEVDAEVTEYMRSTYRVDWDPAKPFGPKGPHPVNKEVDRFAKQVESTSSLLARLSIYLQRTQGFISATIVNREKERAALLAGLPPPTYARMHGGRDTGRCRVSGELPNCGYRTHLYAPEARGGI